MNNFNGVGRLTKEVELRYIPNSGQAVANFTLALDKNLSKEKKQEMESQNKPTADFINCVAWGKTGEFAANYLAKGLMVGVNGSLVSGSYEAKDGTKRYTTDVNVFQITMIEWKEKGDSSSNNSSNDISDFNEVDSSDIPF